MVAEPGATAVTSPFASTVATAAADVVHVSPLAAPGSAPKVAESVVAPPTSSAADVRDGVIERTIGVTVTVVLPDTPPALAITVVDPPPTATTVALAPDPLTVATDGLLVCHAMAPVALLGERAALSVAEAPTPCSATLDGLTETAVIVGGGVMAPSPPPPPQAVSARSVSRVRRATAPAAETGADGRVISTTRNRRRKSLTSQSARSRDGEASALSHQSHRSQ